MRADAATTCPRFESHDRLKRRSPSPTVARAILLPAPRMDLSTSLQYVKGVGPGRGEALAAAGFRTVGDLLQHLPVRYEDRRSILTLAQIRSPGTWTLRA